MKHNTIILSLTLLSIFFNCNNQQLSTGASHPSELNYEQLTFHAPKPPDYRDTLRNGIIVYVAEDHRLPVFDISVSIRTGSIHEPDSLSGLAGLTAGLMRTGGTKSYTGDEIDERVEFLAANLSSTISLTSGDAGLSILKKDMEEGLKLFTEMVRFPRFAEDKLELEKKQFKETVSKRWDNPRGAIYPAFNRIMYRDFPAGVLTTKESIERISRDDLVSFHRQFYRPRNIIFAVSGDINRKEILKKLDDLFGAWQPEKTEQADMPIWKSAVPSGKIHFVDRPVNQAFIRMGHKCIQRPHPDYYALSVLNYILGGGGFASRLTERVRSNEGLAYDVRSGVEPNYFFSGMFTISVQTKSKSAAYAIQLCRNELQKVVDAPITEEELARAKKSLTSSFPSMFRSGRDIASTFAMNAYWHRPDDHFDLYLKKIEALTAADLHNAAKKHLHPDRLATVIIGSYAECKEGDGTHPVKLSDLGKIIQVDVKDLEK